MVPANGPYVAYVGGLNYQTVDAGVAEFFEGGGCGVERVRMGVDDGGKSKGYAHVQFKTRDDLELALTATGSILDGRAVKVYVEAKRTNLGGEGGGGRGGGYVRDGRDGRDGRDSREGRGGGRERPERRGGEVGAGGSDGHAPPSASAVRKPLQLAQRTKPVEELGAPVAAASSIFGEARPRDEMAIWEARRKKRAEDRKARGEPEETEEEVKKALAAEDRPKKSPRPPKEPKEDRLPREPKEPKEPKEQKEHKEHKEDRPPKEPKESKEPREPKDPREHKEPKEERPDRPKNAGRGEGGRGEGGRGSAGGRVGGRGAVAAKPKEATKPAPKAPKVRANQIIHATGSVGIERPMTQ